MKPLPSPARKQFKVSGAALGRSCSASPIGRNCSRSLVELSADDSCSGLSCSSRS